MAWQIYESAVPAAASISPRTGRNRVDWSRFPRSMLGMASGEESMTCDHKLRTVSDL